MSMQRDSGSLHQGFHLHWMGLDNFRAWRTSSGEVISTTANDENRVETWRQLPAYAGRGRPPTHYISQARLEEMCRGSLSGGQVKTLAVARYDALQSTGKYIVPFLADCRPDRSASA